MMHLCCRGLGNLQLVTRGAGSTDLFANDNFW